MRLATRMIFSFDLASTSKCAFCSRFFLPFSRAGRQAALLALALLAVGLPLIRLDGPGCAPLAAAAGYGLAAWYGFRQLDGMSGDISGFALTLGELAGVAVLTLTR